MSLKFYRSGVKKLKINVMKFLGLIPTAYSYVKGENLVKRGGGGGFLRTFHPEKGW